MIVAGGTRRKKVEIEEEIEKDQIEYKEDEVVVTGVIVVIVV